MNGLFYFPAKNNYSMNELRELKQIFLLDCCIKKPMIEIWLSYNTLTFKKFL